MDLLRDYDGFQKDIEVAFTDLIQAFNLKLISPFEGCYVLKGEKCNIKFTFDRGDIFCCFLQVSESYYADGHNIYLIYRILFPYRDSGGKEIRTVFSPKDQITGCAEFISDNLTSVLYGDFSWLNDLNK